MTLQDQSFVVVDPSGHFGRPKTTDKKLEKVCKLCFIALLPRVPCILVLQTTASVMPESKTLSNLAIKRSAK